MSTAKSGGFKATSLRGLLIFLMIIVVGGAAAGFYFGLQIVRAYAVEVSHTTQDATASGAQFDQLQSLRRQLAQTQQLVTKAETVFTTNSNYQARAIADLQAYAKKAGVSIEKIDFPRTGSTATTRPINVTLDQPVSYAKLVHFLQLTETSLPKFQVTSLTISRPNNPNGDSVNVAPIKFNISVK